MRLGTKVPTPGGLPALAAMGLQRDATGVIKTLGAPLSSETCRTRLSNSRRGFLACSQAALPTVLPVELRTADGQLLVTVHTAALRDQLVGQVVALSVGKHAFRYCRGWTVIARGVLSDPKQDGALPLEIAELDGATYSRPPTRSHPPA